MQQKPPSPKSIFGLKIIKSPTSALRPEKVPGGQKIKPRKHRPFMQFLHFAFSILTFVILGTAVAFFLGQAVFYGERDFSEDKTILISKGMSLPSINASLTRSKILKDNSWDQWVFKLGIRIMGLEKHLKAGEYLIPAHSSMHDIATLFSSGRSILHAVTIPEGWTSKQIIDHLRVQDKLTGELPAADSIAEGVLLPETYKFSRGASRTSVLERMRRTHREVVDKIWEQRNLDLPLKNKQELIILASIVEKETGISGERLRIAGVFINRLNKQMRLQSDPTILYGLYGGDAWIHPRIIYKSELKKPNPYNTYQIDGLPPGPIANPGIAALEAVANPSLTEDLFFVADGTGGHAFAKTLKEHQANVRRWREIEKERKNGS